MMMRRPLLQLLPTLHGTRRSGAAEAILAPLKGLHLQLIESAFHGDTLALERGLTHALWPNGVVSDARQWNSDLRLLAWLRDTHFRSLESSQTRLPPALASRQKRLDCLDAPPPTMEEVRAQFELTYPTGDLRQPALERAVQRAVAAAPISHSSNGPSATEADDTPIDQLEYGELLDRAGCLTRGRGAFAAYMASVGSYELVSRELVDALAKHIGARAEAHELTAADTYYEEAAEEALFAAALADADEEARRGEPPTESATSPRPTTRALRVLELGAGNGELSHYLRQALRRRTGADGASPLDVVVLASDDGSWFTSSGSGAGGGRGASASSAQFGRVERLDYRAALRLYMPHVVIVSWMPMAVDWTAHLRRCPSLEEYVLLGEVYDGACGDNDKTWGNPAFAEEAAVPDGHGASGGAPPYELDGWAATELREVSAWMLSRFASDVAECECTSAAISFVRGLAAAPGSGGGPAKVQTQPDAS